MTEIVRRARVEGRVQGVWYRAATAERATGLGVRGYARNQPDGTVEVLMAGESGAVQALTDWLWTGPPLARVTAVIVTDVDGQADEAGPAAIPAAFLRR